MCASWLPVTIRRPDVWELPLVAACACLWWALYFLWRSLDSEKGAWWALAAGAAVALMLGSRPTCVFARRRGPSLPVRAPQAGADPRLPWPPPSLRPGASPSSPTMSRASGSPSSSARATSSGATDERLVRHFSPLYAPYNAWLYLLLAARPEPVFPVRARRPAGRRAARLPRHRRDARRPVRACPSTWPRSPRSPGPGAAGATPGRSRSGARSGPRPSPPPSRHASCSASPARPRATSPRSSPAPRSRRRSG